VTIVNTLKKQYGNVGKMLVVNVEKMMNWGWTNIVKNMLKFIWCLKNVWNVGNVENPLNNVEMLK